MLLKLLMFYVFYLLLSTNESSLQEKHYSTSAKTDFLNPCISSALKAVFTPKNRVFTLPCEAVQ